MAKLVWRVKLVTELVAGETMDVEVARLERDEQAGLADLGLRLAEAKQLMAATAIQAGDRPSSGDGRPASIAAHARLVTASWPARDITPRHSARCSATCRRQSGFGRLLTCPCQGTGEAKSFETAFDLEEPRPWRPNWPMSRRDMRHWRCLARSRTCCQELLPISGAQEREMTVAKQDDAGRRGGCATARREYAQRRRQPQPAKPVVIGLDGGYVRPSRAPPGRASL